jgi:hypothetical protein
MAPFAGSWSARQRMESEMFFGLSFWSLPTVATSLPGRLRDRGKYSLHYRLECKKAVRCVWSSKGRLQLLQNRCWHLYLYHQC